MKAVWPYRTRNIRTHDGYELYVHTQRSATTGDWFGWSFMTPDGIETLCTTYEPFYWSAWRKLAEMLADHRSPDR